MKKTVHVVEYGCNLTSEPLSEELAEQLRKRLVAKGLQCYTRPVEETEG